MSDLVGSGEGDLPRPPFLYGAWPFEPAWLRPGRRRRGQGAAMGHGTRLLLQKHTRGATVDITVAEARGETRVGATTRRRATCKAYPALWRHGGLGSLVVAVGGHSGVALRCVGRGVRRGRCRCRVFVGRGRHLQAMAPGSGVGVDRVPPDIFAAGFQAACCDCRTECVDKSVNCNIGGAMHCLGTLLCSRPPARDAELSEEVPRQGGGRGA